MKPVLLALAMLFVQEASYGTAPQVDAVPEHFQLQRSLALPAGATGQACTVLDAPVYAHTQGRLTALRIYKSSANAPVTEAPFALTESGEAGQQEEPARVLNLGQQGKAIVFDLAMPQRTYTSVELTLSSHDFYASAKVSGSDTPGGPRTALGTYALFDLHSQGLSRATTLPLQEVSFPLLHVELTVSPAPGAPPGAGNDFLPQMVTGAEVPPSRQAQTLYTTVAWTTEFTNKDHQTLAKLLAPAHVPIERAHFTLPASFTRNFSREVRVTAYPGTNPPGPVGPRETPVAEEQLSGNIERVQIPATALYPAIASEHTTIETLLSSNLRDDATVKFAVANGDDAALPLAAVELQMRERRLCFDAEAGATYILRYGDAADVRAPVYDYARLFQPSDKPLAANLGPETLNPAFVPATAKTTTRSYTDRHPELLWVVLLAVISVLGMVAVRSAKRAGSS